MKDKDLYLKILRKHIKTLNKASDSNWDYGLTELGKDYSLTELGIDPIDLPHLVLELEQQFYLVIPDEYLNEKTFSTVETLWKTIEKIKS